MAGANKRAELTTLDTIKMTAIMVKKEKMTRDYNNMNMVDDSWWEGEREEKCGPHSLQTH